MHKTDLLKPPLPTNSGDLYLWKNLHGASTGLALSKTVAESRRPVLIIAPDSLYVSHLIEELQFFSSEAANMLVFPDWETLPYDHFSPHQDIISERLAALLRIPALAQGAVITTVSTLMQRLPPQEYIDGHSFYLKTGDKLNIDILRTRLANAGYHAASQVREHGEFAIRGSIIDLYPMGSKTPFRIDLFDDEVDTIRIFSPDTQRSMEKIDEIRLLPAKEFPLTEDAIERFRQNWRSLFGGNPLKCPTYQDISEGICSPGIEYYLPFFFENTATLFDYLPKNALIVTIGDIETKAKEFWHEISVRYEQGRYDISRPLLAPKQMFVPAENVKEALQQYPQIQINNPASNAANNNTFEFATAAAPSLDINHKATQPLAPLQQFTETYQGRILFCAETMGRREVILQLFKTIALYPKFFSSWQEFLTSTEQRGIVVAPLEEGFSLENPALTLLTETQLYGKRVMQRRLRKKTVQDTDALISDLTELQINDPVVHIDHGVGRYRGLQTLKIGDQIGEFLCLEYQGGDKLYVPVASLHLISRYYWRRP